MLFGVVHFNPSFDLFGQSGLSQNGYGPAQDRADFAHEIYSGPTQVRFSTASMLWTSTGPILAYQVWHGPTQVRYGSSSMLWPNAGPILAYQLYCGLAQV